MHVEESLSEIYRASQSLAALVESAEGAVDELLGDVERLAQTLG
jgi:hypothetical protein